MSRLDAMVTASFEVPRDFAGLNVAPAPDPVFFWVLSEHRRMVVADWGELKVLARRVLRRFRGGQGHWNNLQSTLLKLETPARPAAVVLGRHVVGFVRPWTLGEQKISPGSEPTMIARASRRGFYLIDPVLVPNVERGRELLRDLRDRRRISPVDWRHYRGECPAGPMEKLFMSGSAGVRTDLEHELTETFGPVGRDRQSFTRPDALAS